MRKYKLTIAYDGTRYFGWQIQNERKTIQEEIQQAVKIILKEDIIITASGRTDACVHAIGQVAHFTYSKDFDQKKFLYSLNCLLSEDIKVTEIEEVPISFHARYSATSKIYQYHISLDKIQNPFTRYYSYTPNKDLDLTIMKNAITYFLGTHDFSSFSNKQYSGCAKNKPIKTIFRIDIIENENKIILEFEADGFLYKMVRNIVGTLLDVSSKKISLDSIEKILNAKDRRKASAPAEPQGLFLFKVNYNNLSGMSSNVSK
ncbi:MAG: tRNA pseudouridine(38-40) synthase TruA [Parachlamydiales bacterium]|jgi:tRNA pseudouridine38-40 synthase